ncbi:MAG: glycosyltransferase family 1 protein [Fibrobacter sp.]|nr:glycosyltransferase family 1 protein [Fibrobacter sp.]
MKNAFATTKENSKDEYDIPGRKITSRFKGKYFRYCTENPVWGVFLIPILATAQILIYLPQLIKLRFYIKSYRKKNPQRPQRVVFWSDTLDEVNGIANNIRLAVKEHLKQGRKVHLIGAIHRSRTQGKVEDSLAMLLPVFFAMPQLGYPSSELSIPHIKPLLRLAKRYPPDLIELQTPNPGSWTLMFMARIIGVKAISHYRTDGVGYTRLLVKFKPMHYYVHALIWVFSRFTTPVIVPSKDFEKKVRRQMSLKADQVVLLPRGIDLQPFSPKLRSNNYWNKHFPPSKSASQPVRFISVGRVSLEKSLPFLEEVWQDFRQKNLDAQLLIVGDGPYLQEMQAQQKDYASIRFTGQLTGAELYSLFAEADFFVFPSGNDTFGNVIVESMASGTPVIVSDQGGPKDICTPQTGWIKGFLQKNEWINALEHCWKLKTHAPDDYKTMRKKCWENSKNYSLNSACTAQWEFFRTLIKN